MNLEVLIIIALVLPEFKASIDRGPLQNTVDVFVDLKDSIRQVSWFSVKIDQLIIRIKVVFAVRQSRAEVIQVESKQEWS